MATCMAKQNSPKCGMATATVTTGSDCQGSFGVPFSLG